MVICSTRVGHGDPAEPTTEGSTVIVVLRNLVLPA
jgi:hypothetical protein